MSDIRKERNRKQQERRLRMDNMTTKRYEKTKKGFLMRCYRNMKSRISGVQIRKAHLYVGLVLLDKDVFYKWALNSGVFNMLFDSWKLAGYPRKYSPSIDRIKSNIGYELSNMQWLTHSENSSKGADSRWRKEHTHVG